MIDNFEHIVIGGQQRSGTSLVRAIVGSHSKISIFQWDLPLWLKFSEIYSGRDLNHQQKKRLIFDVLNHKKVQLIDYNIHIDEFNSLLESDEDFSSHFFDAFYQCFLNVYLEKANKKIIGIKTPENEFHTEDIFTKFPKTKFIHVLRNPLDVAVSLKEAKNKWWGGKINYNSHIRLWNKSAETALKNLKQYPDNYLVIKYEDVIENPTDLAKRICSFLNVDFEEKMLEMGDQPGWTGSNSSFKKKKGESNFKSTSINRYEEQLPKKTQDLYFHFLNEHLKYFGYPHKEVSLSSNNLMEYQINNVLESAKEKGTRVIRRSFLYLPLKKFVPNKEI